MIPGPIEVSPAVVRAAAAPPVSHVSPSCIAAFGRSLSAMRRIWRAPEGALPMVIAGSGTLAMELAVWNCVSPGDTALVVSTGWFSERMAEMLRRRGAQVELVAATPGNTVSPMALSAALKQRPARIVAITHVDTSTGVRAEVAELSRIAKSHGALVLVDGVCATVGERLDMAATGVDVYLTASQKAIGAPPGLALAVFSPEALDAHAALTAPPPMGIDLASWQPILEAYEAGRASYFGTPPTSLIAALDVALQEIEELDEGGSTGIEAAWDRHQRVADQMRTAWSELGLDLFPASEAIAANTLSAIRYPEGIGSELVGEIAKRGVVVAGGLHPAHKAEYFRVGHMGWVTGQPAKLEKTIDAVADALQTLRG